MENTDIPPCGPFTASLLKECKDIYSGIVHHPFHRQMADGTLSRRDFINYLEQDMLYLKEDANALALTAEKAPSPGERAFFHELATKGIEFETDLLNQLGRERTTPERVTPNRACREYGGFLVQTARKRSYEESAAALLPCYWIYLKAGLETLRQSVKENPYQDWIDAYAGEVFRSYTVRFIHLVETLANRSESQMRHNMSSAFRRSVAFELEFLDGILKQPGKK